MIEIVLHAIAEPRRREILRLIQQQELTAGEISAHFDVTRPAVSQHLKILTDAGLIAMRKRGTQRLYRVRREGFDELKHFVAEFGG